ncbi:MAG: DUF3306 domain-containing protein [Telluria sp.]
MPNEGFLQRWSRLKADPAEAEPLAAAPALQPAPPAPLAPLAQAPAAEVPLPTLADAALLNADSDYSAFVARGVDASVRRLAMKKLFADPHFNLGDGLDIYMGDYNLASPVSEEMLASLSHAKNIFARVEEAIEALAGDTQAAPIIAEQPADETPALPSNDQEAA